MIPYTKTYPARAINVFRRHDGTTTTTEYNGGDGSASSTTIVFNCTNGLAGNNRRSPTAMSFQKLVTSGLDRRFTQVSGQPYTQTERIDDPTYSITSKWHPGILYGPPIDWGGLIDSAWQGIYDQIRYGNGNLVVDFAESAQTIKMIKNATSVRKNAARVLKSIRRQEKFNTNDLGDYAASKWLEGRYGWMPFISSTYELLETLSKRVNHATQVMLESRRNQKKVDSQAYRQPGFYTTADVSRRVENSGRVHLKVRMRGKTTLEISDFTSLNPALIAWELFPLSFIGDWFFSVGQTLKLWEDYLLYADHFIEGSTTKTYMEVYTYRKTESYYTPPPLWPNGEQKNGYVFAHNGLATTLRVLKTKDRTILVDPPIPSGIRLDVKLGAKRMLDAAALLKVLLPRKT